MNLETERKIKYWLTLSAKILVICFVAFKISQMFFGWPNVSSSTTSEIPNDTVPSEPGVMDPSESADKAGINPIDKTDRASTTPINKANAITPKSASIYIFGEQGLETQLIQQLGKTYFQGYGIKTPVGYDKAQLLAGDLSSSANTELVCVGTISYDFFENSLGGISCKALLKFTTYKKNTGEIALDFSGVIPKTGPGSRRSQAKELALERIHQELVKASPTS